MRTSDQWVVTGEFTDDPGLVSEPRCRPVRARRSPHQRRLAAPRPHAAGHRPRGRPRPGYVAESTPADVAAAVSGVQESISTEEWPLWARSECLHKAARLLEEGAARFAHLIASEGVKTIGEAEREVARGVETLRLSAEAGTHLNGQTIPFAASRNGRNRVGWFTREPVGVVAALTSFNDPLNLVAHKLGPALIAGNGVVLKPSDHTPLTALALVELLSRGRRAGATDRRCLWPRPGRAVAGDRRAHRSGLVHRRPRDRCQDHRRRGSPENADGARREQPDDHLRGCGAARGRRRRRGRRVRRGRTELPVGPARLRSRIGLRGVPPRGRRQDQPTQGRQQAAARHRHRSPHQRIRGTARRGLGRQGRRTTEPSCTPAALGEAPSTNRRSSPTSPMAPRSSPTRPSVRS